MSSIFLKISNLHVFLFVAVLHRLRKSEIRTINFWKLVRIRSEQKSYLEMFEQDKEINFADASTPSPGNIFCSLIFSKAILIVHFLNFLRLKETSYVRSLHALLSLENQ